MISKREEEILKRLDEIRHLEKGLEEIEEFERLVNELSNFSNTDTIPELCYIMEDNASNCSVFEEVVELIVDLIIKSEDPKKGLENVFIGLPKMKAHGEDWAEILHAQILREHTLIEDYIECARRLQKSEKSNLVQLLEMISDDELVEEMDMQKLIEDIEKEN